MAKTYLNGCSAKARTNSFGSVEIKLGMKVEDLAEFCRKYKSATGYLNLVIAERKETGRYGETHSVYLDDYTPRTGAGALEDQRRRNTPPAKPTTWEEHNPFDGDEPF